MQNTSVARRPTLLPLRLRPMTAQNAVIRPLVGECPVLKTVPNSLLMEESETVYDLTENIASSLDLIEK